MRTLFVLLAPLQLLAGPKAPAELQLAPIRTAYRFELRSASSNAEHPVVWLATEGAEMMLRPTAAEARALGAWFLEYAKYLEGGSR